MQFCTSGQKKGVVDAFLDQRTGEEISFALRPQKQVGDQRIASIPGATKQRSQGGEGHLLPEDGARLDRLPVLGWKRIHPSQHQALHGAGQIVVGGMFGGAQQLDQEEGVSCSALDAPLR